MSVLLELAVLCEWSAGASDALNDQIMSAIYRREKRYIGAHYEDTNERVLDDVWVDPATDQWVCTGSFGFTGSLDDAMRLVPKGHFVDTQQRKRIHVSPDYVGRAWARIETKDGSQFIGEATAQTVPLAIAAAALRARALSVCSHDGASHG